MRWQHMDTSRLPGSWTLVTLQVLLDEPRGRSKHVTGSETLNVARGGMSSNAPCIMSCLRPLTKRTPFSSTDVVRSFAKPVKFWTAVMRGLFAQNEMSESLSLSRFLPLVMCPLGRLGLSADAAVRRMHTNLAHASVPDMQRMLMTSRAPQPILDAFSFSCAQCDAMTAPKVPRGVSVPQTVAPLRYVAMDVKWLPGGEEDVRIKNVNIVDEASNLQHIYPFFETNIRSSSATVSSVDTSLRKAPLAQS